jgi:arylformamidase
MHMLTGGASITDVPIDQFVGSGIYVDARQGTFAAAYEASIEAGQIIVFHTGMGDSYNQPHYFRDFPVMDQKLARYLVSKKVKMVGLDACSVDDIDSDYPIHKILLAGGVLIIENLTNLHLIANGDFEIYALPIKIDLDGAPARVIAQLK